MTSKFVQALALAAGLLGAGACKSKSENPDHNKTVKTFKDAAGHCFKTVTETTSVDTGAGVNINTNTVTVGNYSQSFEQHVTIENGVQTTTTTEGIPCEVPAKQVVKAAPAEEQKPAQDEVSYTQNSAGECFKVISKPASGSGVSIDNSVVNSNSINNNVNVTVNVDVNGSNISINGGDSGNSYSQFHSIQIVNGHSTETIGIPCKEMPRQKAPTP